MLPPHREKKPHTKSFQQQECQRTPEQQEVGLPL